MAQAAAKATSTAASPGIVARVGRAIRRWRLSASTRAQILGWNVALLVFALVVGVLIQRSILLDQLDRSIDNELVQEIEELERLSAGLNPGTGEPFGRDVAAIFTTFLNRNIPVEGEALFTIVGGQPFASSVAPVQLLDDPATVARWAGTTETQRGTLDTMAGEVRYIAVPLAFGEEVDGVFVVANFIDGQRDDVDEVVRTAALVFGTTLAVASALAWVVAGRVLRPIGLLTDAAREVREDNWRARIPVRGSDEIVELTNTFNAMLDRLEGSFATQRRFLDDAGHELRTPITIIRGHLDLLEDNPVERAATLSLVNDELDRMSRIVEDLLLLAKLEAAEYLDLAPVNASTLTNELASKATALDPGRAWSIDESANVVVIADRQRLTQAAMNLARNAIEHTPAGTPVAIGTRSYGELLVIWVRDSGPGIPEADRGRIFDRFARGSGVRSSEGAGLGLAIVRAVAEAHDGTAELDTPEGGGARFVITIPVEGPRGQEQ